MVTTVNETNRTALNQAESERQHELAEFLRSRRARLTPEQVGLPRGTRRRTPGLRRSEVAALAGVSLEWYTWLEQGRDIHVSVQLLESLTRVLQLDANERDHLFLLALRQSAPVDTYVPPKITPTLQQFLDQLGAIPASVIDARANIIAWNTAHSVVFGDYDAFTDERNRNLIWRLFTHPRAQQVNEEWEELASVYLAQFRAGYGRFIDDPWWAQRIAELSEVSPEFRRLWARHDVLNVSEGRKTFHHPLVGVLKFDFVYLSTVDSADLRLLIHTARPGTGTAEKIERLLSDEFDTSIEALRAMTLALTVQSST
ncbi:MAG TPA: helix-turn-helix transcriptional regulator [Phototrophicaceae bacterium]|nr:helix-turn-helix transcriptional regulator [Phototrophicaceae bacterium]